MIVSQSALCPLFALRLLELNLVPILRSIPAKLSIQEVEAARLQVSLSCFKHQTQERTAEGGVSVHF